MHDIVNELIKTQRHLAIAAGGIDRICDMVHKQNLTDIMPLADAMRANIISVAQSANVKVAAIGKIMRAREAGNEVS